MLKILLAVVPLFWIVGCGIKAPSRSAKKITRITQDQINVVMNNQNFECASIDGNSCPVGISRLFTINQKDPDNSSVCSGFMVGPNRLVTNNHCVPDASACKNTHIVITAGNRYFRTSCKRIIYSKEDTSDPNDPKRKIDVTVMETTDIFPNGALKLSRAYAAPRDRVSAWVIDHTGLEEKTQNLFNFRITELKCTLSEQTTFTSLIFNNCPVIHGNSGSPATNFSGEVVAVIWGSSGAQVSSNLSLEARRTTNSMASATDVKFFEDYVD